ncbi:MAG: hypothetical protein K5984_01310 [Bacteroidales bacterium]|nr:hypothetical protein [Bacteroidales bacterium]
MKDRFQHILLALLCIALPSCKAIDGFIHDFIHDDEIVAQVGAYELYVSDVTSQIPHGLSPEDSLAMANQIITTWAEDKVLLDMADRKLSKREKNVTKELQEYQESLLKYRYEQRYINERLDTAVTADEVRKYYEAHKGKFILDAPIVKISFKGGDPEWIESSSMEELKLENADDKKAIKILEKRDKGTVGPVEYFNDLIRDIIVSGRKRALSDTLEQELLDNARAKGTLKIYSAKKDN